MHKLYCYVDESGQDTQGEFFVVSVVITEQDRIRIVEILEQVEHTSGKGQRKWMKTRDTQQVAYMRGVLAISELAGNLCFSIYRDTKAYLSRTVLTTARAITTHSEKKYKAVVFVDGLPRSQRAWFGTELRHLHVATDKIRG